MKVVWLPHRGIPAAVRNAAIREATGTHVAFLDSDDLWAPRKLERQIALLTARPECSWSYTAFRQVDCQGAPLAEEHTRRFTPHQGEIFEQLVAHTAELRTPSVMVARQLLRDVGGFDEAMRSGEDYDLWMRLALWSPVALVDEPLVDVRRHDHNHSRNWAIAFDGRDGRWPSCSPPSPPGGARWSGASAPATAPGWLRSTLGAASVSRPLAPSWAAPPTRGPTRSGGGARCEPPPAASCGARRATDGATLRPPSWCLELARVRQ